MFIAVYSIYITGGYSNYDLLKVKKYILSDIFGDHVQIVHKATHITHTSMSIKLLKEVSINLTAENIYFSDHDAVRIVIDKNAVDFHTIS